jgi:hypothetical protein
MSSLRTQERAAPVGLSADDQDGRTVQFPLRSHADPV